jgi:hypothetical protein
MKLISFLAIAMLTIGALYSVPGCKDKGVNPGLDTTSHNFVWYSDTLGGYLSKVRDVCCLSETNAWAVGYFYKFDDSGNVIDSLTTNVAHWDGKKWTLLRVNPLFQGHQTFSEVEGVLALDTNDIWITPATHWNGHYWTANDMNFAFGETKRIWGRRPDDIYFVGKNGSIVHWNGYNLKEIGFSTTAANCDVWGWNNTIYLAVTDYDKLSGYRGYLLRMENGVVKEKEFLESGEFVTVWGTNGTWYAAGCTAGRIYKKETMWQPFTLSSSQCKASIRGTSLNNVFFVTDHREVYHFNGLTFKQILPEDPTAALVDASSAVGRALFIVDTKFDYAVVYRVYRTD